MSTNARGWAAVALQAVLLVLLVALPTRRTVSQLWPPDLSAALGVMLIVAGVVLFMAAAKTLSTALTPTPVPLADQNLRTSGVYAWLRHPIYSAVLLAAAGFTLCVGSWWQVLVTAALVVFFVLKAQWEDTMLSEQHGSEWEAYRARTGALWPIRSRRT